FEAALGPAGHVARYRRPGHRQVADLARRAADSPVQPAAEHDRHADAPVQPEQHEVVDALGRAGVQLGDGGQVDVVLEHDRALEVLAQLGEQTTLPVRQVEGEG